MKTTDLTASENIDLTEEISLIAPADTPLFSFLMQKGLHDKATGKVVSWRERTLATDLDLSAVEGADATEFNKSGRAEKNNQQELFINPVAISGTALASEITGVSDLMAEEVNDRLTELKVAIEKSILNGKLKDGSTTPFKRKMQGLQNFVTADNKVKNATLTEKALKDTVKKLWDNGLGSNEFYALVNADLKEEIDKIYKDSYHYVAETNEFGIVVTKINTNYGVINLILDRHMDTDKIIVFDPEFIRLSFLRQPQFEELGKTGDSEKGQVLSEVSLKVLNEKAVAMFTKSA